ncbi:hypothetical protein [Alienimonas chondri]|uniref:Uncharacterized protein n=1 Tax=Alienimonas chondri TaxID=2681879 RepID=A0ABX1VIK3_9PLAN|nr:hypothetical protein [Alienimonas chondri]NNJ27954.1 hypothetical protein [Alienimonas chondri]
MDKLQPLITHRFWIALGLTICLALGAWWMGTGALSEQISADEAKVEGTIVSEATMKPNPDWIEEAEQERLIREQELRDAAMTLATTQEDLRTWPESYQQYVEGVEYFKPIAGGGPEGRKGREQYRFVYEPQIEQLRESLRPYDFETQTGVMSVPEGVLPTFDTSTWQSNPPLSMTVWSAQEDIWLMRELLKQLNLVNAGANTILKAPLKEIQSFKLRGGAGLEEPEGVAAAGAMSGGYESENSMTSPMGMESSGMDGYDAELGAGGAGGGGAIDKDLLFTLDDEIGPEDGLDQDASLIAPALAPAEADAAAGSGIGSVDGNSTYSGESSSPGFSDYDDFGSGGVGAGKKEYVSPGGGMRYITSKPEVPYRTRAFRMQLVVDHRHLTDVLANLSNSAWPVEIVRVHLAEGAKPVGPRAAGARGPARRGMEEGGSPFGGGSSSPFRGGSSSPFGGGPSGRPSRGLGLRSSGGLGGAGLRSPRFGGPTNRPAANPNDPYLVAMADPYLATVVIGGVMTIYKPRTEEELALGALQEEMEAGAAPLADPLDPTTSVPEDETTALPADASPAEETFEDAGVIDPLAPNVDPDGDAAMEDAADLGLETGIGGGDEFEINLTPPPGAGAAPPGASPETATPPAGDAPLDAEPDAEPVAEGAG